MTLDPYPASRQSMRETWRGMGPNPASQTWSVISDAFLFPVEQKGPAAARAKDCESKVLPTIN